MTSNLHLRTIKMRTIKMRTIKMRTIKFGLTKDEIKKFLKILSLVSTKNFSGNRTYWQDERLENHVSSVTCQSYAAAARRELFIIDKPTQLAG